VKREKERPLKKGKLVYKLREISLERSRRRRDKLSCKHSIIRLKVISYR